MMGGCELTRTTGDTLRAAGQWGKVDLARCNDEPWHFVVPHISGVLTK